ncbi:uncharacterized protein EI97DRAFT_368108 [Westerdykella ornata]|uniref:Lysine-specific metallo-endopeptidase domain-containing protein n=1 Tax=Westerdykella ornata TaxID=318751 RepID=A0A6A6JZ25_WESOR|nr:uncharacterized protein EI97DRAFT_368108 [Westerdykella ornata]KAF2281484.1 hypothetical protein EI97DRAFT_368108 [Westerdykella ornata]
MLSISKTAYLFCILFTTVYSVVLPSGCNQGNEPQDIDNAIQDAVELARAALAALTSGKVNGNENVFKGAYNPLFAPEDRLEDHVVLHRSNRYWVDKDYASKPNAKPMPIPIGVGDPAKGLKPGAFGSYATLGYKFNDEYDTEGHGHIYIAENRRRPPTNTFRDVRRYPDIVRDGLDPRFTALENIKPLAQTMLHELIHVAGGLTDPDPNRKNKRDFKINDGPSNDKTYGWMKCNKRRKTRKPNIHIADCITFLAQAIYLQIGGKDTYWTTGEVDINTLRPKHIPRQTS